MQVDIVRRVEKEKEVEVHTIWVKKNGLKIAAIWVFQGKVVLQYWNNAKIEEFAGELVIS